MIISTYIGYRNMKTYRYKCFSQICESLMQIAQGVAVATSDLVVSDMVHSLSDFHKEFYFNQNDSAYYFAIREMGVESGLKKHCIERCKGLGYPLVIAKVEKDHFEFTLTIMLTHNWMSGDNNYMEQEFNSI